MKMKNFEIKSLWITLALSTSITTSLFAQMPERIQMAYNYCTQSYTMALWSEKHWEAEIDRLAKAGFTHVLVNPGMEAVWFDFLTKKLGTLDGFTNYTVGEARAHIPHPTWRAWWLMGNLEGEGAMLAPVEEDGKQYALTVGDIERQRNIGRTIVKKCWEHGMTPVLNAFMGLMPTNFDGKYPNFSYLPQTSNWCSYVRPDQLLPTDPIFPTLAKAYHETLFDVYGITDEKSVAFSGDLFHEGGAKPADDNVTTASAIAVQKAMQEARPGSIWFIQHWNENPTIPLMKGCDPKHTVIQKLDKDMRIGISPSPGNYYRGMGDELIPWVWTEVTNFGDNPNFYGSVTRMEETCRYLQTEDAKQTKCLGWGMLDEGITYQQVYYASLINALATFKNEDDKPAELMITKMPVSKAAWDALLQSVYIPTAYQEGCSEGILCAEPHRGLASGHASAWGWGGPYYDKTLVRRAGEELVTQLEANPGLANNALWREFYIDVMRQIANDAFTAVPELRDARLFKIMDILLLRSNHLHLWHYWKMALELSRPIRVNEATGKVTLGKTDVERALFHYRNYLCLMTIWRQDDTTNSSGLHDYSHRNLGGMMSAYYGRRWGQYWAGKSESEIRTTDAQWWKTAPIPRRPIEGKGSDLLVIGKGILEYDITKYYQQDETLLAPLDNYGFDTLEAANTGYSGRQWAQSTNVCEIVNGHNGEPGALRGTKWSTMGMPTFTSAGGAVSIVLALGETPEATLFSTSKAMSTYTYQWEIQRGLHTGEIVFHGLFTEGNKTITVDDDTSFNHIVINRAQLEGVDTITIWVNGEEALSGKAVDDLPFFSGMQVNARWGGDGVRSPTSVVDDLRFYSAPLKDTQIEALSDALTPNAGGILELINF